MPDAAFSQEQLVLLFDHEAIIDTALWLPSDTQLTQWVGATLLQSSPAALDSENPLRNTAVEISLACVTGTTMRELNAQYRNADRVTNVLSFPADMPVLAFDTGEHKTLVLGDIVICPDVLTTEAKQQNKSLEHHWAHMVVHSVLHLNGLDHDNKNTAQTMESLEIQILSELGISTPYLADSARLT